MGSNKSFRDDDHDEEAPVPGFRFHPTDEELVGFYLRRKLAKKPLSIELIKQIDIYKYDPWDLPKFSSIAGEEKEHYFFCKRGRKYRNSIRPNRVITGSGFWKATGIDKPVYSHGGEGQDCIGLKKTLVYYRGTAGKGTKTDWMMHEFRLPPSDSDTNQNSNINSSNTNDAQEAEIWTLCRIFKRNASHKKYIPERKELSAKCHSNDKSSKSSSTTCSEDSNSQEAYISFCSSTYDLCEQKPAIGYSSDPRSQFWFGDQSSSPVTVVGDQWSSSISVAKPQQPALDSSFFLVNQESDDLFTNWDELGSVVEFSLEQI